MADFTYGISHPAIIMLSQTYHPIHLALSHPPRRTSATLRRLLNLGPDRKSNANTAITPFLIKHRWSNQQHDLNTQHDPKSKSATFHRFTSSRLPRNTANPATIPVLPCPLHAGDNFIPSRDSCSPLDPFPASGLVFDTALSSSGTHQYCVTGVEFHEALSVVATYLEVRSSQQCFGCILGGNYQQCRSIGDITGLWVCEGSIFSGDWCGL